MITGAAFCPHPPVLVPDIARRAAVDLAGLRAACRTTLQQVAAGCEHLVLLGSAQQTLVHTSRARGSFAGFGVPLEVGFAPDADGAIELPLSLAVGAWLIDDALRTHPPVTAVSVAADFTSSRAADELRRLIDESRVGLVVMGDGSARRSTAAPGYLDEHAVAFDDGVLEALRAGDAAGLADVDLDAAAALLAAGAPAWRAAGALLRDRPVAADVSCYEAPYGVAYFVAHWTSRG
ncbi:MAG: hypothetical protein QOG80_1559 [Pseudonocardiales bacterium]|nr:hypothetical protein [Pseudonocardiales bacterium]